ncbi:hypothetical protein WISP_57994 [Willisornis vidua]|uniref:Prolactin receptor n=1 Tax=Willisornis vidua TaxID=1566151 RepID=A0ABQ9DC31_9PASS|nr:hypothetical protein WISP_57994 [Willisornis vidua]
MSQSDFAEIRSAASDDSQAGTSRRVSTAAGQGNGNCHDPEAEERPRIPKRSTINPAPPPNLGVRNRLDTQQEQEHKENAVNNPVLLGGKSQRYPAPFGAAATGYGWGQGKDLTQRILHLQLLLDLDKPPHPKANGKLFLEPCPAVAGGELIPNPAWESGDPAELARPPMARIRDRQETEQRSGGHKDNHMLCLLTSRLEEG